MPSSGIVLVHGIFGLVPDPASAAGLRFAGPRDRRLITAAEELPPHAFSVLVSHDQRSVDGFLIGVRAAKRNGLVVVRHPTLPVALLADLGAAPPRTGTLDEAFPLVEGVETHALESLAYEVGENATRNDRISALRSMAVPLLVKWRRPVAALWGSGTTGFAAGEIRRDDGTEGCFSMDRSACSGLIGGIVSLAPDGFFGRNDTHYQASPPFAVGVKEALDGYDVSAEIVRSGREYTLLPSHAIASALGVDAADEVLRPSGFRLNPKARQGPAVTAHGVGLEGLRTVAERLEKAADGMRLLSSLALLRIASSPLATQASLRSAAQRALDGEDLSGKTAEAFGRVLPRTASVSDLAKEVLMISRSSPPAGITLAQAMLLAALASGGGRLTVSANRFTSMFWQADRWLPFEVKTPSADQVQAMVEKGWIVLSDKDDLPVGGDKRRFVATEAARAILPGFPVAQASTPVPEADGSELRF
jgi:hypothetical protein